VVLSSAPIYPPDARRLQIQGIVVLNVLVDETGKVTEAKIVSGPVFLQQAAMDSVRKWKYQPARLDGQPIAIHINVGVNFSLR
jgi:protein TonB